MSEHNTLKLYSNKAISIATFFGGPLAAGVLMRQNFKNLGNDLYANHSLAIGILSTIVLFGSLVIIPEHINEKIPNALFPAIYTAIIYFVVESLIGEKLKNHKEAGGEFYSGWKAAGIGFVSSLIIIASFIGIVLFAETEYDEAGYLEGIEEFSENESNGMKFYELMNAGDILDAKIDLEQNAIPLWVRNVELLNELNAIENLPEDLRSQNQLLMEYSQLRVNACNLIKKSLESNSNQYDTRIELLHLDIEAKIEELANQP